jgi:putative peptide zinc metalloprotease protein
MVVFPVLKGVSFLATSPVLREKRPRAVLISAALVVAALLLLFAAPFPLRTVTEGVIWVPEESLVRARTDGFVGRVVIPSGTRVTRGQVLVECRDPFLDSNARVLHARLEELQSRYDAAFATDRVQPQVVKEEMASVRANLARAEERVQELNIVSPSDGVLILPDAKDLPDLFLKQGDLVGYVLDVDRPTIRVVVPQSDVDLVRRKVRKVEVRMADRLDRILHAAMLREVPEGLQRLPSTILGRAGGGQIAIDPFDKHGTKTFENLFQFDIEMVDPMEHVYVGARAHVRFDHGFEPAGFQIYRGLRQLFLKRFNA